MSQIDKINAEIAEKLTEYEKHVGDLPSVESRSVEQETGRRKMWDVLQELKEKKNMIERAIKDASEFEAMRAELAKPKSGEVSGATTRDVIKGSGIQVERNEKPFRDFGAQLSAIVAVTTANVRGTEGGSKVAEYRNMLADVEKRGGATGVSANVDSEAGFMIQTDFAGAMWDTAVADSGIISRCDSYNCSADSNAVEWMRPKETDISADAIYDGIKMYRAAEAESVTATKGFLERYRLELEKSMGLAYWSGEAVKHAAFLGQFYQRGFTLAIMRQMENEIISGTGVGQCKGILNSGNAVQSKSIETGQTLVQPYLYPNITGMWNILHTEDRANAIWMGHPDTEEKLMHVTFPVGTGGVPVFLAPGGGIGPGVSTLYQRPVVPTDHCSAVGTPGDLILANLNKYMIIRKGTADMNTSIHVRFLYDEEVFRVIIYYNGIVKNPNALTIKNSNIKRASFVTLAARV